MSDIQQKVRTFRDERWLGLSLPLALLYLSFDQKKKEKNF